VSDTEVVDLHTTPRPHKSFFNFLSFRALSEFRVDGTLAHRQLASACFRITNDELYFNMRGFDLQSRYEESEQLNEFVTKSHGVLWFIAVISP